MILKDVQMGQDYLIYVILMKLMFCTLFLIILIVFFKKSGVYSYLIFCKNDKNKDMVRNYLKIIDQVKEEMILD